VRPYLKINLYKKRAGGVAQFEGHEFKPQYHKKKKKVALGRQQVTKRLNFYLKFYFKVNMVDNPSTWEAEAGGSQV
jgi:hypothetical protein